jgi:hypothetical protein
MGLFGSLLKIRNRQRRKARLNKPAPWRRQPFLESLETRALLSVLATSPKPPSTKDLTDGGLADNASMGELSDHQGDQHHDQGNSPGNGPQDGGKQPVLIVFDGDPTMGGQPSSFDAQLAPDNGLQDSKPQGQEGNGPGGEQGDGSSDPGSSQGDGSDDLGGSVSGGQDTGTTTGQGTSDAGPGQNDGSNSQTDKCNHSQGGAQNSGDSQEAPGKNSPSDTRGPAQDGQSDSAKNDRPDRESTGKQPSDPGQDGKTNGVPTGGGVPTSDGTNTLSTGQGNALDKKPHGSSNGSVSEEEPRSPVGTQEGKQHGPDGVAISPEEVRVLSYQGGQEPEQGSRNQAGALTQQQSPPMDETGARPAEERVAYGEVHQRLGNVEESSLSRAEAIATFMVLAIPEPVSAGNDYSYASPQDHGLLTDSLALDFSSLRLEVQSFFELVNNLGGHPTEKQIGVLVSCGAVVVAAAMACEVARRQARRPAPGSPFTLVSRLEFANDGDAASGAGLPHFGQFSALR